MRRYLIVTFAFVLLGCQPETENAATHNVDDSTVAKTDVTARQESSLEAVLAAQPDEVKARYKYRHPKETIELFGIVPGMTVVEGLPGRGWYTKILLNYLGADGRLIGADYSMDMWPLFPFGTEAFVAEKATWIDRFKSDAASWSGDDAAAVDAFVFGSMPDALAASADIVFFPRVLHNLANFQNAGKGDFLDIALADAYAVLKPGGVFGVVQHEAHDDMSDEFADGTHGYLKKAWVIEQVENAGFEFVADSDINKNPKDLPSEDDVVWRLPPSYSGAEEDMEKRAVLDTIGESNRMTLKFRKPE